MPDVAVVIPTRDRPGWLRRAVRLALAQRGVDVRVEVVDDASEDDQAVRAAAGDDPRVTVHRCDRGVGVASARNAGLEHVEAPRVAFLDDDDIWHPDWLVTACEALDGAGAQLAFGPVALLDRAGGVRGWERAADPLGIAEGLQRDNVVGVPSQVVLETALVRRAGGFDPAFSALADWQLWWRLRDAPCAAVDRMLVAYTVHEDAMHVRDPDAVLAEFARLQAVTGLDSLDAGRFRYWLAEECARYGNRALAARMFGRIGAQERRPAALARATRLALPVPAGMRRRFRRARHHDDWWRVEAEELARVARESSVVTIGA